MTNVHPESHVAAYGGFVLEGGGVGEVIRSIVSTPSGGGESFRGYQRDTSNVGLVHSSVNPDDIHVFLR